MNTTELLKEALQSSDAFDKNLLVEYISDGGAKKLAIEELRKKGLPLTPKNLNAFMKYKAKDIESNVTEINHLDKCNEREINELSTAALINLLSKIEKHLKPKKYEYQIRVIGDMATGKTDIENIVHTINLYCARGWRLKEILTNELGKDMIRVGVAGVNSTRNEFLLLFERELEE